MHNTEGAGLLFCHMLGGETILLGRDDLLALLEHLLDNLLDDLLLLAVDRLRCHLLLDELRAGVGGHTKVLALLADLGLDRLAEVEPVLQHLSPPLDDLLVSTSDTLGILFLKDARIVAEVLANLLLFFLGEQGRRPWAPRPLLKLVDGFLAEGLSPEIVDMVSIFHLRAICQQPKSEHKGNEVFNELTECFHDDAQEAT